jgi:hypothetical protein
LQSILLSKIFIHLSFLPSKNDINQPTVPLAQGVPKMTTKVYQEYHIKIHQEKQN